MDGIINEPDFDQSRYADEGTLAYIAKLEQQLAASLAENLRLRGAANRLIYESEEYEFDDGVGKGALQLYWDDLESALSSPPGDQSALREVIARVLEEYAKEDYMGITQAIEQLRSGEWTPEVLK